MRRSSQACYDTLPLGQMKAPSLQLDMSASIFTAISHIVREQKFRKPSVGSNRCKCKLLVPFMQDRLQSHSCRCRYCRSTRKPRDQCKQTRKLETQHKRAFSFLQLFAICSVVCKWKTQARLGPGFSILSLLQGYRKLQVFKLKQPDL